MWQRIRHCRLERDRIARSRAARAAPWDAGGLSASTIPFANSAHVDLAIAPATSGLVPIDPFEHVVCNAMGDAFLDYMDASRREFLATTETEYRCTECGRAVWLRTLEAEKSPPICCDREMISLGVRDVQH
jgi:hypothetical protein